MNSFNMPELHKYENIQAFAQSVADTNTILEELNDLSPQELTDLNNALDVIDDQDPIGDWASAIREGDVTNAFAEISLAWHFRRVIRQEAVTLNAAFTETGKDFDLLVEWNERAFWIDVRTPDGALREVHDRAMGWIAGESVGNSISNKLDKQFKPAREELSDDAILVLAVYLKATALDQLLIGKWLHDTKDNPSVEHPGRYCDAFLEYTHHHGKTTMDVRELTDQGTHVTELRDELLSQ